MLGLGRRAQTSGGVGAVWGRGRRGIGLVRAELGWSVVGEGLVGWVVGLALSYNLGSCLVVGRILVSGMMVRCSMVVARRIASPEVDVNYVHIHTERVGVGLVACGQCRLIYTPFSQYA